MKGFKKCGSLKVLLGILFCTLSVVSFGGSSANAATYHTPNITDNLILERDNYYGINCEAENVSSTYTGLILDSLENRYPLHYESLQNAISGDGRWTVTQIEFEHPTNGKQLTVRLDWTEDNSLYLTWASDHIYARPGSSASLSFDESCNYISHATGPNNTNKAISFNTDWGGYEKGSVFIAYVDHPNYPQDYDGEEIPQSHIPLVESNWTPDIKLHKGDDWNVELSDYNFFTFDRVAFTCGDEGFAPLIDWSIYDITGGNNDLIDTMTFSASAQVNFQAPKIQEDKRYNIVAKYSGCDNTVFMNSSNHEFTVRKDGTLNPPDYMSVCIREDFPFINIPDCLGELDSFFATITFRIPNEKNISGGGWTTLVNGCRELQVVGSWIFSEGKTVCPQFSSTVRGIMTPIVTFALALGVITFISNRQGLRSI